VKRLRRLVPEFDFAVATVAPSVLSCGDALRSFTSEIAVAAQLGMLRCRGIDIDVHQSFV
jgi:hypothetical protein